MNSAFDARQGLGLSAVTNFSAGDLPPLFTTTETNTTTTPALAFGLSNAGSHQFFGNNTGGTAAPAYVQPNFTDLAGTAQPGQVSFSGMSGTVSAAQGGLPTGGTAGQTLVKNSATNYDASWSGASSAALAAWPVGSIFISIVPTNPATLLGGGTWVQFGQGRMIVGQNPSDTDFSTPEGTGGAKTVTLATANLPLHTHAGIDHTHDMANHGHTVNSHFHLVNGNTNTQPDHTHGPAAPATQFWTVVTSGGSGALSAGTTAMQRATTDADGAHSHTINFNTGSAAPATGGPSVTNTGAADRPLTTGATGSGAAVSVLPPYIVCYMWKRTA